MWGSALGCGPLDLEITEIGPCMDLESQGQGMLLRKPIAANHHEMILPLFCVWLCCFQDVSFPPLRTWPRNKPTEERIACLLVPAMLWGWSWEIIGKVSQPSLWWCMSLS